MDASSVINAIGTAATGGFTPLSLLAGLIPLFTQAGKAAISRWIAPQTFKPSTIDEYLRMRAADTELFKAVSAAGGSNPTYMWVEAVKQLQRPVVATIVLITWSIAHIAQFTNTGAIDNFAGAVGFYLFADRTLFYVNTRYGSTETPPAPVQPQNPFPE